MEESEKISFAKFKDKSSNADLMIVKNYIYAVFERTCYCSKEINEIQNYSSEVFPVKCTTANCYYIIGLIDNTKTLYLYLYENPTNGCNNTNIIFLLLIMLVQIILVVNL